jgi:hypothetical protein
MDPILRLDTYDLLSAPRELPDGSWRFDAVLARADAPLRYAWGVEVATEAALSDLAYLDGLVGLAIVLDHPEGGVHRIDRLRGEEVGRVIGARWDATERAVVISLVVTRRDAIGQVRSGRYGQVSEGYSIPKGHLVKRADGVAEQRRRISQHVALTPEGRAPGAVVRTDTTDTGGAMTPEQILAAIKAALAEQRTDAAHTEAQKRADAAEVAQKAAEQRADAAEKRVADVLAAVGLAPDAKPDQVATAIQSRADEIAAVRADAARRGVSLPATGAPDVLRRAMAVELGIDSARADDAGYVRGWLDARAVVRTDSVITTAGAPGTTRPLAV